MLAAFQAAVKARMVAKVGGMGHGRYRSLHALLCIAENSVSSIATRPDDVHTMYSGRTVRRQTAKSEYLLYCGDAPMPLVHVAA